MISVLLPTYNGSTYIARAIRSVLDQTVSDFELIIVDDGSTDTTEEIVKMFAVTDTRIIYLKNVQNVGIQKSLNRGLAQAKGEYIARIDDDDEWVDDDKLKKQVDFLNINNDHCMVGTGVIIVDEGGRELVRYLLPEHDSDIRKRLLGKNCFVHSSVVFKRAAVVDAGGYDESPETRHVEDYDLWLKFGATAKLHNIPSYAVRFTARASSLSSKNKINQFKKDIDLTKKYKDRYPGYAAALFRGYLRLVLYGFFSFIPFSSIKGKLMKLYKER